MKLEVVTLAVEEATTTVVAVIERVPVVVYIVCLGAGEVAPCKNSPGQFGDNDTKMRKW